MGAITQLLAAMTAYFNYKVATHVRSIRNEIDNYNTEIKHLSMHDELDALDILRIQDLQRQKRRAIEEIEFIRSASSDTK